MAPKITMKRRKQRKHIDFQLLFPKCDTNQFYSQFSYILSSKLQDNCERKLTYSKYDKHFNSITCKSREDNTLEAHTVLWYRGARFAPPPAKCFPLGMKINLGLIIFKARKTQTL